MQTLEKPVDLGFRKDWKSLKIIRKMEFIETSKPAKILKREVF
jgi:hypothetical protein